MADAHFGQLGPLEAGTGLGSTGVCAASEPPLTAREREVLALVAEGMSNKQIATSLAIASATVERHVTNIYAKIGVRCRAEAALRAVEMRVATRPQYS